MSANKERDWKNENIGWKEKDNGLIEKNKEFERRKEEANLAIRANASYFFAKIAKNC